MTRLLIIFLLFACFGVSAQQDPLVNGSFSNSSYEDVLASLEKESGFTFYYEVEWLDSLSFSASFEDYLLSKALDQLFEGTQLEFFIQSNNVFITKGFEIIDRPSIYNNITKLKDNTSSPAVEKGLLFEREYLASSNEEDIQSMVFDIGNRKDMISGSLSTIAGYVRNVDAKETLNGALVYTEDFAYSATTDENGFYSITIPNGRNRLVIQYVGMKTTKRNVILFSNGQLNVELLVDVIALQEVVVESERDANIQSVEMGVERINVVDTKSVPIVLGESDIMKIATTFAGVQTLGEGASGFNVRGGKSDQNLIILNDATIYNASHFFGFFSVFNSDAIQDMKVYKSGIPARFGGRLSSVFDITSKEANNEKFEAIGGISPVTSKLTAEIPIIKGKAGLMIGGRTTYSNWLLRNVANSDFSENRVSFSDLIMRYDHKIDEKNDILASAYYSKDNFRLSSDTVFSFSNFSFINKNASIKWSHRFSDNFDGTLSGIYSGYGYQLSYDESAPNAFSQDFGIEETSFRAHLNYYLGDIHTFKSGAEIKKYEINPGTQTPRGEESIVLGKILEEEQAIESTFYLSDEFNLSNKITLYGGLRYSIFSICGPQTVFNYTEGAPKNFDTRSDSTIYKKGDIIKTYQGLEYRASVRYALNTFSSIKASYNRTRQYVHTLSNSASLSPTDTWRLSSTYIRPQIADQYSIGYYRNFLGDKIETSLEAYYKDLQNLIDFKVGSQFLLNEQIETVALQGPGKSYGIEFSVKKSGKLNGWVNYSYARTFIKLDGNSPEETINEGAYYPANYDMPHTINLVANYKLTKRVSFSYNFTYNTGRPVTYPVGEYTFKGAQSVHYADRNSYRIPDYMRMDLGITLLAGHRIAQLAHSDWSISVYNFLGRDNPFSVFFDVRNGEVQGYQLIVFGNPIPTVTYNFRF